MSKKLNIAINGFGRIGRAAFKIALEHKEINVVAINDLTDTKTLAHLLKYDSVYGRFNRQIDFNDNHLIVDNKKIPAFAQKNPADLPWQELKVDVVLECTGVFRTTESAQPHIKAGAKKVIISAPAKDDITLTCVLGVNHNNCQSAQVINNASCTTNCSAPVMKVVSDHWGVKKAFLTTIHSYTADQNLVDGPHKDLRRARSAALNIVPTSTGAAKATAKTIPSLQNKFDGLAVRVPTPVGSLSDFVILTEKSTSVEEVIKVFKAESQHKNYQGILTVSEEPLVSSDIIGNSSSCIIDLSLTQVIDGDFLKIVAWYDNEWGYANRLVEMAVKVKN